MADNDTVQVAPTAATIAGTEAEMFLEGDISEIDELSSAFEKAIEQLKAGAASAVITLTVTNDFPAEEADDEESEEDE